MKKLTFLLPVVLGLLSMNLNAEPCSYASFQPGFLYDRLAYQASESNLTVLNPYQTVSGLPAGRTSILANGMVVAQATQERDVAKGFYALTIFHPSTNQVFLQVTDTKFVCPTGVLGKPGNPPEGLCHRLEAWTDLQKPVDKLAAFSITWGPRIGSLPVFRRYSAEVSHGVFKREFAEAYEWLLATLATVPNGYRPEPKDAFDRISWQFASDVFVAPYLDRFRFSVSKKDKRVMVVHGVAPSDLIYGRVIDLVRSAGFPYVDPQIKIDTRTRIVPVRPEIKGCTF